MTITVFIRYQLDPFKRGEFEEYARKWLKIIPKCGGELVGYWMPHEGTNNIPMHLYPSRAWRLTRAIELDSSATPKGQRTSSLRKEAALFFLRSAPFCAK